jgi:short-subunit dehydrogenase
MISPDAGIIITGASRGIGASIALYLAANRKNPQLLIGRDTESLQKTASRCREIGGIVHILAVDLLQLSDDKIKLPAEFKPSVLINNAGHYIEKDLFESQPDDYTGQFSANVLTAISATQFFLTLMIRNQPGLIINICSVAALEGIARSPAYSVAKHGLLGFSRSLRKSVSDMGIAVTAINLGSTESGSWEGEGRSAEELIDPADVARIIDTLMNLSVRSVADEILMTPAKK